MKYAILFLFVLSACAHAQFEGDAPEHAPAPERVEAPTHAPAVAPSADE